MYLGKLTMECDDGEAEIAEHQENSLNISTG
jgi:hypothetical protein